MRLLCMSLWQSRQSSLLSHSSWCVGQIAVNVLLWSSHGFTPKLSPLKPESRQGTKQNLSHVFRVLDYRCYQTHPAVCCAGIHKNLGKHVDMFANKYWIETSLVQNMLSKLWQSASANIREQKCSREIWTHVIQRQLQGLKGQGRCELAVWWFTSTVHTLLRQSHPDG